MKHNIRNIALAGSGNVASHLAKGLQIQGFTISGIWSREQENARKLAKACGSKAYQEVSELQKEADLIIIAVPDKAIAEVAAGIGFFKGIMAHTAGSVSMDMLKNFASAYGVFYPLQTFSKDTPVDLKEVPFFIEASEDDALRQLKDAALKLSEKVYEADSATRLSLHVAAVFAGNYSNLMFAISNELLKKSKLPLNVLNSLILETARKAATGDPYLMQTGPARRNDVNTIEKHISSLAQLPDYAELYSLLASMISKKYK